MMNKAVSSAVYKPVEMKLSLDKATDVSDQGPDFAGVLKEALSEVNALQFQQQAAETALVAGVEDVSLHQVMIITEQARLSLEFTMAVRNKIMDAYNEIMRMQI